MQKSNENGILGVIVGQTVDRGLARATSNKVSKTFFLMKILYKSKLLL